ncbi:MAG: alanine dehydrogenase, partial [Cutibacterium sp.]|nr:alanine dehydrogenase [Cutibacterium sp.]
CGSRGDLRCGLATHGGKLLSAPVGEALGIECVPVSEVL